MGTSPVPPQSHAKFTKAKSPTLADATEVRWHKTVTNMYAISDSKLNELTAGYNSLYLLFCGICLGAFVSIFIALRTSTSGTDKPMYLAAAIVTGVLGVFFGIIGLYNHFKVSQAKKKLHREAILIEPLK